MVSIFRPGDDEGLGKVEWWVVCTGGVIWWAWINEVERWSDVIAHAFAGEDELTLVVCGS